MRKIEGLSAFHMFTNSYEEALDMWFDAVIQSMDVIISTSLHEDFKDMRDIALEKIDSFIYTANEQVSMLMIEYSNIAKDYKIVRSEESDAIFIKKANDFKNKASDKLLKLKQESDRNNFILDGYNNLISVSDYTSKVFILNKLSRLTWLKFVTDMKNGNHPLE